MPRKGMRTICFSPKRSSTSSATDSRVSSPSPSRFGFSPSRPSFSDSVMDRTLEVSGPAIMKWDPEGSNFAKVTSLIYENRREAKEFIKCVYNLQKAMQFLKTEHSSSDKLVRGQNLMQIAMKRLQKEFYQVLSMNRAHLDPESVSTRSSVSRASTQSSQSDYDVDDSEDETRAAGDSIAEVEDASSIAMADLRLIAECMISSGYAKECLKIYKVIRKSIIDEGLHKLGVEKLSSSQVRKMDPEVLDLKIKSWLGAVDVSMKTLFNGERILCDHVFASSSDSIRELIFTEISNDGATILFGFSENVAKNSRKWPEKTFRLLDMYTAIANRWTEIESIFSSDSASTVRDLAVTSLVKLGESIRSELGEFETALQKDSSKTVVAGGGIHSLTIESMNYLTMIADYSNVLGDILADSPPPETSSLPESYFGVSDTELSPAPAISLRFAWLILVLLCKLDRRAQHYKDVSMAYLFLANNLQFIAAKVRVSNLKFLLGDNWSSKQEAKVKQFAENYERLAWGHVISTIPQNPTAPMPPQQIKEHFKRFNSSFEQAHRKHSLCVVHDTKLRNDLKLSIATKLLPVYREFYNAHRLTATRERSLSVVVRFAPEDVSNCLSDLFFWTNESTESYSFLADSSSSHATSSTSH
ncbi:exocyst complex component EXO70H1-like [Ipomoea triloba]|uniref:exocyst complex component EXO70H1-like n=1 Tax=Ipomoea triloba TaxID=35885 RepID=UPI00125D6A87|nr:exocyst complex component EXO70H1-like [Ipomoea triloba]